MWEGDEAKRAPLGDFPPPWASAWGDDVYGLWADLTVNGVTQRMRWIEPSGPEGFWMGSTKQERDAIDEKDVRDWASHNEHEPKPVVIEHGFWLADTPCTLAFWLAVKGEIPTQHHIGVEASERPVDNVTWDAVIKRFVSRFVDTPDWGAGERLALPTEAEWEYAARAGTRTAYWWGDDWNVQLGNINATGQRRWQDKERTTPVKQYPPNPWGLYDVHGNVWEWCVDEWRPPLGSPEGQSDEACRVVRGGSWKFRAGHARAACRSWRLRQATDWDVGFRFVLRYPGRPDDRSGRAGGGRAARGE